jgi:hypothetical protein
LAKLTTQIIDQVQALFAEARMLLQDAEDFKGTVHISDDFSGRSRWLRRNAAGLRLSAGFHSFPTTMSCDQECE